MFRRLVAGLPQGPVFPEDAEKLGYFINDKDQIRKIKRPDEKFQFYITNNARYNEVHREALHSTPAYSIGSF